MNTLRRQTLQQQQDKCGAAINSNIHEYTIIEVHLSINAKVIMQSNEKKNSECIVDAVFVFYKTIEYRV